MGGRIEREKRTVAAMIDLYCRMNGHQPAPGPSARDVEEGNALCVECSALKEYALTRLDRCRYGDDKPTCRTCPTHCYQPAMREKIRDVMRFSGPRMLGRHPLMAIRHLFDERR